MAVADTRESPVEFDLQGAWPLFLGYAVLVVPTLITLGQQAWSREIGAHGPIILATGAWLLWRAAPDMRRLAAPGALWIAALALVPALGVYIFGRTYGFLMMEAAGVYVAGLVLVYVKVGWRAMLKAWFPLFYLGFSVPPPTWVVDRLTAPLKEFASFVATSSLHHVGLPIAREGVIITIGAYQLQVEDACSGMHSIVGLIAISLLYVYLMRGPSLRYLALFLALSIPTAVVVNVIRIIALVLLTYFCGDRVGQGFLHKTAGIALFAVALLFLFAIDKGLDWITARATAKRKLAA
jgi:exosortase